ncbi:MAG: hypothetical protein EPO36_11855 [Chloroflexota bacterium]|nr:MAG: hypothetical protein EPO36_11855 [Chloroflexota bacterium]
MARAKRTDRADARRRYRQTISGDIEGLDPEEETPAAQTRGQRPATAAVPPRPSLTGAFRGAYRRANIREDIAALPGLLRTRSFLGALGLIGVGAVAVAVDQQSTISAFLYQSLLYPPAMAPIFLVGFFAKRASYLLGLIVSLIDVAAFTAVVYLVVPAAAATPIEPGAQEQAVLSAISIGPVSGIFFAAAAAWYRRFLNLSNTRAQQRRQTNPRSGRPARG